MKIKSFLSQYLPVIIAAVILTVCLTYAWTPPSSNPPEGNVSAPINTGDVSQSKEGDLNIGGGLKYWITKLGDSFALKNDSGQIKFIIGQDGNIGIGKNDPNAKLDVNGRIKAQNPVDNNDVATKGYVDAAGVIEGKNAFMCYVNCESSDSATCASGYTRIFLYGEGKGCTTEGEECGGFYNQSVSRNSCVQFIIGSNLGGVCYVVKEGDVAKKEGCEIWLANTITYTHTIGIAGGYKEVYYRPVQSDSVGCWGNVHSSCAICCK